MKYIKNRLPVLMFGVVLIAIFGVILTPSKLMAAGETFTWEDYRNITVSGGDLKGSSNLTLSDKPTTGDQLAVFYGDLIYNKGPNNNGCRVDIQLYFYKTNGTGTAKIWNPPPYDAAEIGGQNSIPRCYIVGVTDIDAALHNQWVNIGGTRPADPNGAETDEQKSVYVTLLAPDPKSVAPTTATITIKNASGQTVASQTVAAVSDANADLGLPPEQTPVGYRATFMINPGDYEICATYVITDCQKFTKERYNSKTLKYGNQYQMPYQRSITVNVQMHGQRHCGSSLTQDPVKVILKKPDGSTIERYTAQKTSTPNANEEGQLCTVNTILGDSLIFDDMAPGTYEACGSTGECVSIIKVDGEGAVVTLDLFADFNAPDEQAVCNAGTGFAGWIAFALCPVAQLIVDGTDFIENNFIIPYLTVSPLSQDANNAIYKLWDSIRNIANILFIVAFFIIIFSQATSVGISNYGIKRLLPRLILVAIATNLSYYIVAFAIDAFNIFGAGVADLVMSVISSASLPNADDSPGGFGDALFVISAKGLSAAVIGGGAALLWLSGLLVIMFLIILVAVVVLILRQMFILGLVIVAPLALIAALLPNTEKYFTKWYKLLIQLLVMYPVIVLLFAVGKLMAALFNTGDYQLASGAAGSDTVSNAIKALLATFAAAFPLILLPAAFAIGGVGISKISDRLKGLATSAAQRSKQAYDKSKFGQFRQKEKEKRAQDVAKGAFKGSAWRYPRQRAMSAINKQLNAKPAFNTLTGGYGAYRGMDIGKEDIKEQNIIKSQMNGDDQLAEAWIRSKGMVGTPEYNKLDVGARRKFDDLAGDGLSGNRNSYAAAMKLLAQAGNGNQELAQATFKRMEERGANQGDINSLSEELRDTWRGKGRGDLVGDSTAGGADRYKTFTPSWSEVDTRDISRYSFADANAKQSFRDYITTNREGLRSVVAGLDNIKDARAKPMIIEEIQKAYAGRTSPITGRTFSRDNIIDEMRSEFKLQGF